MPPCLLQARADVPQTDGFGFPQAPAKRQTPGPRGRSRNPGAGSPWPQALGGPPGLRSPSSQSGPAHSRGAARGPESPGLTAPHVQGLRPHHGDAHLQQPDSAPTTLSQGHGREERSQDEGCSALWRGTGLSSIPAMVPSGDRFCSSPACPPELGLHCTGPASRSATALQRLTEHTHRTCV